MQINKAIQRLVIIIIILVANFSLVAAETPPPPPIPSGFYGTIKLNGENVEVGETLTAWIGGQEVASTQVFIFDGDSVYSILVPGDENTENSNVEFYLNGHKADQDGIWHSGTNTNLSLTFATTGEEDYEIFLPLILR